MSGNFKYKMKKILKEVYFIKTLLRLHNKHKKKSLEMVLSVYNVQHYLEKDTMQEHTFLW